MRRLIVLFLLSVFLLSAQVNAEEAKYRFSNWPLAGFDQRKILKPINLSSENLHSGIDISAEVGEEVRAPVEGKVYWTYSGGVNGIAVGIEHANGMRTTYLHLSERLVKKGQTVNAGDIIGKVGITGTGRDSVEPHLQFDLIINPSAPITSPKDRYDDPLLYGPLAVEPNPEPLPKEEPSPSIEVPVVQIPIQEINQPLIEHSQPLVQRIRVEAAEPGSSESMVRSSLYGQYNKIEQSNESVPSKPQVSTSYVKSSLKKRYLILKDPILHSKAVFNKAKAVIKSPAAKKAKTGNNVHKISKGNVNTSSSVKRDSIVIFWFSIILVGLLANLFIKSYNKSLVYDFLLKAKTLG